MTEVLRIPSELSESLVSHSQHERPNEACGLIAGAGLTVTKVVYLTNALASPMRYEIDHKELQEAQDLLDEQKLDLIGVYHSHTRTEAFPSPTDVKKAVGDLVHVIVSLRQEPAEVRAFRIEKEKWGDETGQIVEIPVEIDG